MGVALNHHWWQLHQQIPLNFSYLFQGSHCLAQNKLRHFPGPQKYFPGPCHSPKQHVNIKTNSSYLLYAQEHDSSIHTAMFITVTCSEKMFCHCKKQIKRTRLCGWEYFCICIIASTSQQIPGLSRTFNLNFQDFPGSKSFSRTFQAWKFYKKIPRLSRRCRNPVIHSQTMNFYLLDSCL